MNQEAEYRRFSAFELIIAVLAIILGIITGIITRNLGYGIGTLFIFWLVFGGIVGWACFLLGLFAGKNPVVH